MKSIKNKLMTVIVSVLMASCSNSTILDSMESVDYVDPYIGNISHLLVPTFPTVHLPNSMLRVYPERGDFTSEVVNGLPLAVTSHRGSSAFNLSPSQGNIDEMKPIVQYTYDREEISPYGYKVILDEDETAIRYAVSHQSGIYQIDFSKDEESFVVLNSRDGEIKNLNGGYSGFQNLDNNTRIYIYMELDRKPTNYGQLTSESYNPNVAHAQGQNAALLLSFGKEPLTLQVRYGISFISEEQAKKNLYREQGEEFDYEKVLAYGRKTWNEALNVFEIDGEEQDKILFYTSLYRCYERPVCISEDGKYFSAFDGQVHQDNGTQFYTDNWIWDTYRATHPLRILIDHERESDIINSFLRMAKQMGNDWMPTFPEITGDSRRMNSNHGVATIADAYAKGLKTFDLEYAYTASRKGMEEKTLAPWSGMPAGELDKFYKENGYIPAINMDEKETIPEVHHFEKRQPIAVTLGTAYDQWCLSQIATALGKEDEAEYYLKCAYNYHNVFHPETHFFHPKDKDGEWIMPFDYNFPGGMGAREFYGENNGWVYRWDVPHNIPDLIDMMGGAEAFEKNLDDMYRTSLGRSKYDFYAKLPDHTGNVGQFSMANEPSLHIPYLYNYCGKPWRTQKRIRTLVEQWFRNDLMGVPGDEDGGGMSAFVNFTMLGFYPVTPGLPVYSIGTPFFPYVKINMSNGRVFEVIADGVSKNNKYIQSVTINDKLINTPFITHDEIANGGKIVFTMGSVPNYNWGIDKAEMAISAKRLSDN